MNRALHLLISRPWSIAPEHLRAFAAQAEHINALMAAGMSPIKKYENALDGLPTVAADVRDGVAWIEVAGTLLKGAPWWAKAMLPVTDLGDLAGAIRDALSVPKVEAIALRIDSPGGSAMGLEEVAAAIAEAQAVGIPVNAVLSGLCCSAGYWIASCCDRITASPDSLVGCIGIYTVLCDSTAADAQEGLAYQVISSGGVKGHGADGKVTPELRAEVQAMVDAYAAAFRAKVADGRDLTPEQVTALATGQSWIAAEAHARGLVDAVEPVPVLVVRQRPGAAAPAATTTAPATATPAASTTPPAASADGSTTAPPAASTPESPVLNALTLAALIAAHPNHAALIAAEAQKPDASEASLKAAISAADGKALAEAKAKSDADLVAERAEHAKTKAELEATKAKHAKVVALIPGYQDPGPSANEGAGKPAATKAEYDAMTPIARAKYFEAGGSVPA